MSRLAPFGLALAVASCAPNALQIRLDRIERARGEAHRLSAPRQASSYADAVHAAYLAGDYRADPEGLRVVTADVLGVLERALPVAGVDTPTLVAWRGLMLLDSGQQREGVAELVRSFQLAPNALAGRALTAIYGSSNQPQRVGQVCAATLPVLRSTDEKLSMIALCRKQTNAASNEGEMAWMSPELIAWYQAENARRLSAEVDALNAEREQSLHRQRVVRENEQCTATCKERGLNCQNRCYGNAECERRCVGINHACLDRCSSKAYQELGY